VVALKPTAHSPKAARVIAAGLLDGHDVRVRDTVVLLVSELVSNAVQHGGPHGPDSTLCLEVETRPDRVRVGVTDAGAGEPRPGNGAIDRSSGRGLLLVEALASSWGCDRLPVGKTVWFELLTPAGGDPDA
jgi:anti-sigma regulatory factor (Ser/Thr protein kinase)